MLCVIHLRNNFLSIILININQEIFIFPEPEISVDEIEQEPQQPSVQKLDSQLDSTSSNDPVSPLDLGPPVLDSNRPVDPPLRDPVEPPVGFGDSPSKTKLPGFHEAVSDQPLPQEEHLLMASEEIVSAPRYDFNLLAKIIILVNEICLINLLKLYERSRQKFKL